MKNNKLTSLDGEPEQRIPEFPKKQAIDYVYSLIKIFFNFAGQAIPKNNGLEYDMPLETAFSEFIESPFIKRRDNFIKRVATVVAENCSEIEVLKQGFINNQEQFFSLLAHALPIAIKNHQEQKLQILANVVVNSFFNGEKDAASIEAEDDKEFIILNLVDQLTPSHIFVLNHLQRVRISNQEYSSEPYVEFLNKNRDLVEVVVSDLEKSGLIFAEEEKPIPPLRGSRQFNTSSTRGNKQTYDEMYNPETTSITKVYISEPFQPNLYNKRISSFGWTFLKFIEDPSLEHLKP